MLSDLSSLCIFGLFGSNISPSPVNIHVIFISGYLDKILAIVSDVKAVFLAFPLKLA